VFASRCSLALASRRSIASHVPDLASFVHSFVHRIASVASLFRAFAFSRTCIASRTVTGTLDAIARFETSRDGASTRGQRSDDSDSRAMALARGDGAFSSSH